MDRDKLIAHRVAVEKELGMVYQALSAQVREEMKAHKTNRWVHVWDIIVTVDVCRVAGVCILAAMHKKCLKISWELVGSFSIHKLRKPINQGQFSAFSKWWCQNVINAILTSWFNHILHSKVSCLSMITVYCDRKWWKYMCIFIVKKCKTAHSRYNMHTYLYWSLFHGSCWFNFCAENCNERAFFFFFFFPKSLQVLQRVSM